MRNLKSILLILGLSALTMKVACAQGTAFTYQGRLNSGTNAANGSFDVQFTLFSVSSGGGAVAGPVVKTNIGVTNGLFTTMVDFGSVFTGSSNWLELAVRTNGAASFSPALTPRQQLTPAPYAIYAETANASNLVGTVPSANLSGVALLAGGNNFSGVQTITGGNSGGGSPALIVSGPGGPEVSFNSTTGGLTWDLYADNAGYALSRHGIDFPFVIDGVTGNSSFNNKVGFGTTSPQGTVEVHNTGGRNLVMSGPGGAILSFYDNTAGGFGWDIDGSINAFTISDSGIGYPLTILRPSGNVGIGTTTPATLLDVNGTGHFGGNVGIGTTTPQVILDVYNPVYAAVAAQFGVANCGGACGQTDYQEAIRLWNQNPNGQVGIGFTVGGGSFTSNAVPSVWLGTAYGGNANDFQISTLTNTTSTNLVRRVYINGTTGNVGIGTISPATALQVAGTVTATAFNGDGSSLTGLNAANLSGAVADGRLSANVALRAGGNALTGNQTVMSGNVGIGTTTPSTALQVAGTVTATAFSGNGSNLTSLSIANLSGAGTVPDTNLSANVALLSRAVQSFTGGTNSFAGSVGVGTTTPAKKFDVTGTAAGVAGGASIDSSVFFRVNNNSKDGNIGTPDFAGIGFGHNSTQQAIVGGTFGNDYLDFYTGGLLTTPKMRMDINGNITLNDPRVASAGSGAQITFNDYFSGAAESSLIGSIGNGGGFNWRNGALELRPAARLNIYRGNDVTSSSQVAMTMIGSSGNVGIGTTTPGSALEVNGTVTASGFSGPGTSLTGVALLGSGNTFTTDQTVLGQVTAGGPSGAITMLDRFHPVGDFGWQWVSDATGLNASRFNGGAGTEYFTISTNGNVGIGTISPNALLQVAGTVGIGSTINTAAALSIGTSNMTQLELIKPGSNIGYQIGVDGNGLDICEHNVACGVFYIQNGGNIGIGTGAPTNKLDVRGSADFTGKVGIGTTAPNSDSQLQVKGMVRLGSETGTSEAPNRSIVVRRINSSSVAIGQVVARSSYATGTMTLERDGTQGGLVLKVSAGSSGAPQLIGVGINVTSTTNVYQTQLGFNSSTQIFTDAQRIGYCRLTFGDALNNGDMTTVELTRLADGINNGGPWVGTVTSTVNQ